MMCAVHSFVPDAVSTLLYPRGSSGLAIHRDSKQGWVCGLSLGCSATFFFQERKDSDRSTVKLESGDLIVYNATKLLHGIEAITENSGPEWWKQESGSETGAAYGIDRFVVQFRDSRHVQK